MKKFVLLFSSLLAAALSQGQIIHVPADYPTIQQGINAATPGDTVLVAEGTYYEQISLLGKKPIMVASQFLMDGNASHIANTIIDGSQITRPDSASVVYFVSGEDTTSVINGFTIRHGKGTLYLFDTGADLSQDNTQMGTGLRSSSSGGNKETYVDLGGGGIFISGSGARIINNHITENHLSDTIAEEIELIDGAGITTQWLESDAWVVIEHNVIDNNTIYATKLESFGVGMNICYNARITGNTVSDNTNTGTAAHTMAAGIGIAQNISFVPKKTFVEQNLVQNNLCESSASYANSAGVFISVVHGHFIGNNISQNVVSSGISQGGVAGLYLFNPADGFQVRNNVFKDNTSNIYSGGLGLETSLQSFNQVWIDKNYFMNNHAKYGGAIFSFNVPACYQNNVFSGNSALVYGGAVQIGDFPAAAVGHFATFVNNSFSGNQAGSFGGAISSTAHPKVSVVNSVFWNDSANIFKEIRTNDSIDIVNSNINLNEVQGIIINGGGNISVDPLFEDSGLLTLSAESPCINTGTSQYTCTHGTTTAPLYDILDSIRPYNTYFDMGAYEYYNTVNIDEQPYRKEMLVSLYPNPFEGKTVISYALSSQTFVMLTIFNATGNSIQTLANEFQQAGKHSVTFDASVLPSGVYFYRLQAGNRLETGKMTMVK